MKCHSFIIFFSLASLVLSVEEDQPGLYSYHAFPPSGAILTRPQFSMIVSSATVTMRPILHSGHMETKPIHNH